VTIAVTTIVPARPAAAAAADEASVALCTAGEIWGGVEQCVSTCASSLRAAGVPVVVVLFREGPLAARIRAGGLPLEVLDRYPRYDARQVLRLRRVFREYGVNVVHLHGYKATILAGLAAASCGIATVKTEHGRLERARGWRRRAGELRMRGNLLADRLATRLLVDEVAFVSHDLRRRGGGAVRECIVIHNGVERRFAGPRLVRGITAVEPDRFHAGIVGRLVDVKGHRHAIDAMRRLAHLPDVLLHVFGTGPLEEACRVQCLEAGLADRVVFHGFCDDVHERVSRLDVLVMPSLQEGLPFALLEAMQIPLPIVASDLPGIREVLPRGEDDGGLLVPPGDPDALAAALGRLHGDRILRRRLAAAAHRRVMTAFLADDMVRRYRELYAAVRGRAS
jgi:glycosyltransferase involved in cell wall biosynthesis